MKFSEEFKSKLYQSIGEIEEMSQVELVTMFKPESGNYRDISYASGALFLFIAYTYLMFSPIIYEVYSIYFMSIIAFFIGFFLLELVPFVKRFLISTKRQNKQVELYSRAIFQKAGIRHTSKKVGVLIYVSAFERQVRIIADRGVKTSIPARDWENLSAGFKEIFAAPDSNTAFFENIEKCKTLFVEQLPVEDGDINELPNNLDVDI